MVVNTENVFSKIGASLIAAQRVEHLVVELLSMLTEYNINIHGITTEEFLQQTKKLKRKRRMLGEVFRLLKLNPKFVLDEFDEYLEKRNLLVHRFFQEYLHTVSAEQEKKAIKFCYEFVKLSEIMESFFKGFIEFVHLHFCKSVGQKYNIQKWEKDYIFFMQETNKKIPFSKS